MNILIEGSDGAGKTTTIDILKEVLDMPVVKGSTFEHAAHGNEFLFNKFYSFTDLDNYIFDRTHISNRVYAQLYKDYSILTPEQMKLAEEKLKPKSLLFYLFADLDVVIERVSNRGDDYVELDMIKKIRDKYEKVLSETSLDVIRIDTTNKNPHEVAKEIVSYALSDNN